MEYRGRSAKVWSRHGFSAGKSDQYGSAETVGKVLQGETLPWWSVSMSIYAEISIDAKQGQLHHTRDTEEIRSGYPGLRRRRSSCRDRCERTEGLGF